ncbi:MAG: glutathione S-transferase C-terminal domain-containing protein [Microbacterium sp.]|nr:glutathione S-transferase C-terminal domain-containing protein [Microbacterium sp.]
MTTMGRGRQPGGTHIVDNQPPWRVDVDEYTLNGPLGAAVARFGGGWADAELARREFLCGEHLTLADIAWGVHAHRWLNMDFDRPDLPNLSAWYLRLLRHESFRTKWAGPIG